MKIETKSVLPNVYVLTFDTQYNLCMSFVRMQEFYESQKFRGKYFTLEEFIDYWSTEFGKGSFNYPSMWNGFNLPGKVILKWTHVFAEIDELRRDKECDLIQIVEDLMEEDESGYKDIYVIGVHDESTDKDIEDVIEHESAHALYTLYPSYKRSCNKLLKSIPKEEYEAGSEELMRMGYGKNVINDELQAYFSTQKRPYSSLIKLGGRKEFAENFEKYKEKYVKLKNKSK